MNIRTKLLLVAFLDLTIVVSVKVTQFVWLPDVFTDRHREITRHSIKQDEAILLVQYWNRRDFYTLELLHYVNGGLHSIIISGDAPKIWKAKFNQDSSGSFSLKAGPYLGTYNPKKSQYIRHDGLRFLNGSPSRSYDDLHPIDIPGNSQKP